MPRLYLIDGYALIYRAFYALISRPLRTSRGENTSAAWGVANFLIRLRTKYHPDYVIWINDAGDSGRTEIYTEYKSTREKLDEAMQQDFDLALTQIESLLAAFRVKKTVVAGWENRTSQSVPPVKSMPSFRPEKSNEMSPGTMTTSEMVNHSLRLLASLVIASETPRGPATGLK